MHLCVTISGETRYIEKQNITVLYSIFHLQYFLDSSFFIRTIVRSEFTRSHYLLDRSFSGNGVTQATLLKAELLRKSKKHSKKRYKKNCLNT